jgi:hypothetical protein
MNDTMNHRLPVPCEHGRSRQDPFFPIDQHAPIEDFERIVDQYPVFRVA